MPSTVDSTLNNTKPSAKPMRVQPNKVVATSPISVAASAIWEISIGDNAAVATDLRDFCWTMFLLLFKCVPKGTNMKKRECKVGQIFSVSIRTAGALKLSPAHSRVEDREDHLPQSKDERHKNEKSEARTKRTKRYQKKETTYQTTGAETTDLENDATLEDLFYHREKVRG